MRRWLGCEEQLGLAVQLLLKGDWSPFTHRTYEGYLPESSCIDPNNQKISSWRFLRLAVIPEEFEPSTPSWHLPWTDSKNQWCRESSPPLYCYTQNATEHGYTNAMAVTGTGTAFDESHKRKLDELGRNTILVIEVDQQKIHWMEPGDVTPDEIRNMLENPTRPMRLGTHPAGFHVGFSDNTVLRLQRDIPFKVLEPFLYVDEAQKHDRDKELGPYIVDIPPPE